MISFVSVTDLFCGAGGSSWGASQAGAEIQLAVNHWPLAIQTHNSNFPDTDHDCTDISAVDPRRYRPSTILIASPECTNHSLAKGQSRKMLKQLELFGAGKIDPSEERSRATMWDVVRFAEYHHYEFVVVENVVDVAYWPPFEAWLQAMNSLGYDHRVVYLNSMFAHLVPKVNPQPDDYAPQSRDRLYVVFWNRKNSKPDLEFNPLAYCQKCERNVEGVQSWRNPRKKWGRYGRQYDYRCPTCATLVQPYYYAAANAINWSLVGERIGDRKRPLRERTMERIRIGLEKYGRQMMLVGIYGPEGQLRAIPGSSPVPTLTSVPTFGMVVPLAYTHGHNNRAVSTDEPLPTQTARQDMGVAISPFLVQYYTRQDAQSPITEAMGTITAEPRHAVVTPPFVVNLRAHSTPDRADIDPLMTVVAGGNHHALIMPEPFLFSFNNNPVYKSVVRESIPTVTTLDRHGLVQQAPTVNDCHFRMLQPSEIGLAMAFPPSYQVLGTNRDKVRQYGNAVTPIAMRRLVGRCLETLQ